MYTMQQNDISAVNEIIAEGFQSVHSDGARDRQEEIELIRKVSPAP